MNHFKKKHLVIFSLLLFFIVGPAVASQMQAAVNITATAGSTQATVDVVFKKAATSVEITVYGVRGLNGLTEQKTTYANVTPGQKVTVQANYTAPAKDGAVAVCVTGNFGGLKAFKAQSFRVAGQNGAADPGVKVIKDASGQSIVDTPAEVVK